MNIDNFFQRQNENFTIDNSKEAIHWQQLQAQLVKPKLLWKPYAMVASIALLVGVAFYIIQNKKDNSAIANTKTTNNKEVMVENPEYTQPLTSPLASEPTTTQNNTTATPIQKKATNTISSKAVLTTSATPITINKSANFYIDLTKAPELFTINPTEDNTITCKQGTTLTIPANSVINNEQAAVTTPVTLSVQEYYRYDGDNSNNKATAGMLKYVLYQNEERLQVKDDKTILIKMSNGLSHFKLIESSDALPEQQLQKMTWVSNEKFYSDTRKKITYKITLDKKYNANTFMSQIAFTKHNALVPGNIENNSLVFENIPVGETIYFISLGKVGDKYFSCSKKLVSGNTNITTVDFVEISETLYHQQLDMYGKLGKND